MVQIRPDNYATLPQMEKIMHRWKLEPVLFHGSEFLLLHGLAKRLSHPDRFFRAQLGMTINYDTCQNQELRKFCADRGLYVRPNHQKEYVIRKLLEADMDLTFDKFLSLPPEIRICIYEWYLKALIAPEKGELLNPPPHLKNLREGEVYDPPNPQFDLLGPPPIAQVSKTIRKESLGVLFREKTINIEVKSSELRGIQISLSPETQIFSDNAPTEIVENIRQLVIKIWKAPISGRHVRLSLFCEPSNAARFHQSAIRVQDFGLFGEYRGTKEYDSSGQLHKRLTAIMAVVKKRESKCFVREDIPAILEAFRVDEEDLAMDRVDD